MDDSNKVVGTGFIKFSIGLEILGLLLWAGCSSTPHVQERASPKTPVSGPMTSPSGQSGTPQEAKEFKEIEALFSKNYLEPAQQKMMLFSRKHPRSPMLPSVENLYGLALMKTKNSFSAIDHFKRAIDLNPNNVLFNQYILYNLASAQADANQLEEAQQTANQIQLDIMDKPNRVKVYYLRASLYEKKSLPLEAARQLLSAGRLFSDADMKDNRRAFNRLLDQSLQGVGDVAALEKLYHEFEDTSSSDSILFRLGSQEMAVGSTGNGELHLKTLLTRFPQTPYAGQATELLNNTRNQAPVESDAVGVLLPMKGKFSKFGMKSLQGIQLAFGIFNQEDPDTKINLIVEDSGDEPEQAIRALNRLVFKHHVVAIIGPMLSKGTDQISQKAQELGVPLISLARKAGPPQDYVFQAGLTQQIQAYEIARYAIQKGAKRFAMIYPSDKMGAEMSQSFWDAVDALGGKMVGAESYTPGDTDFRHTIDRLSGLFYTEGRQRELDELAKQRDENKITKRNRKTEQYFGLKPIVDYDAVFVPDDPKVVGQILPTFAYRDIENVKFLGISSWNSPEFLTRVQNYGENAAFVDAYFPPGDTNQVRRFTDKYKRTYGQDPTALEALAYDAGLIVKSVVTPVSSLSRSDVREKLKAIHDLQGVTGKISFKDGQFYRDLRVITVKSGHFALAQ